MRPVDTVLQSLLSLAVASSLLILCPSGPFGTKIGTIGLVDTSRHDPFASKPENRSTVISAIYPAYPVNECCWSLLPAYPKQTAAIFDAEVAFVGVPNGTFENSVASFGFIVVTVDHPYDADVVEFSDGRVVLALNSTWDDKQSEQDVDVRVQDVSFVLDQLSERDVVQKLFSKYLSPTFKGLKTSRADIFGHSLGGATAAMAMFRDSYFVGGVDLDGGLYRPVINQGLKSPFMIFGHQSNETSDTWPTIWPLLSWKLDIGIFNSKHTTFIDIPILAELVFGTPLPKLVQSIVGGLPPGRALEVITAYLVAFMNMVLRCQPQVLLQRSNASFPEIDFVARL